MMNIYKVKLKEFEVGNACTHIELQVVAEVRALFPEGAFIQKRERILKNMGSGESGCSYGGGKDGSRITW